MIEPHINEFRRNDRDIKALTYVVIIFLAAFASRAAFLIYECEYQELWSLIPLIVPLLTVLVVVRVANRLISNGNIIREDDRRQEIVRTTHHLIAITKDLKARVSYVKKILTEGGRPPIALVQIAKSIEDRYETLLQRECYKYLPGPCIDIITSISGNIFGIVMLAECVKQATSEKNTLLMPIAAGNDCPNEAQAQLNDLVNDLQKLLDYLFELRHSVNEVAKKEKSSFKRYWSFLGIILATTSLVLSLVALNQHYEGSWGGFVVFLINLPFSALILFIGNAFNFNQVPLTICTGMVQWYFIGWLIEYAIKRFHSKRSQ